MTEREVDSRMGPVELEELAWGLREARPIEVKEDGTIRVAPSPAGARDEEEVVTRVRPTAWGTEQHWYEKRKGRLLSESEVMNERFPRFRLVQNTDGSLSWVGALTPVRSRSYVVELRYPPDYPFSEPAAYVLRPTLEPSPHRLGGERLCLIHASERPEYDSSGRLVASNTWLPSATAVTIVPLVSVWLGVYEYHRSRCRRENGVPCTSNCCPDWPGPRRKAA